MALTTLLDTNVVLYELQDRLAAPLPRSGSAISVITELELLSYPGISQPEENAIRTLLISLPSLALSEGVKREAIEMRRQYGPKLPDAIIAATAKVHQLELVTNDAHLLGKLPFAHAVPLK